MSYIFSEAQTWPHLCALKTQGQLKQLSRSLHTSLRSLPGAIQKSNLAWEYKLFWAQSAELLIRQTERSKKLKNAWGPLHDQLFEDWNKSEHAAVFLKSLNKTSNIKEASRIAEANVKEQLIYLAEHLFDIKTKFKTKAHPVFELGQFKVSKSSEVVALAQDSHLLFESWDKSNFKSHLKNIVDSLSLIKTHSPYCYDYLKTFTQKIIPIKQKELVSYSLQSIPGHSFINLYNRDRLDLLDDLIHENGHHHLNHFLILHNPLVESPELLYFSPWRDARRPLRGIYHAYMTFYFAQKLYFDLIGEVDKKHFTCTKAEKEKIYFRFCEETLSLNYSAKDIERAHKAGRITLEGFELFQHFRRLDKRMARSFDKAYGKLNASNKKKLQKFFDHISSQDRWKLS